MDVTTTFWTTKHNLLIEIQCKIFYDKSKPNQITIRKKLKAEIRDVVESTNMNATLIYFIVNLVERLYIASFITSLC